MFMRKIIWSKWQDAACLLALLVLSTKLLAADAPTQAKTTAVPGKESPAFTLKDADGKDKSLADFRGQSVPVYFFCGCRLCHKCARAWSEIERGGTLETKDKKAPPTLIIFHGDAAEARTFAEETQLDAKHNILLCDADEKVTQIYGAELCPRVFVVNRAGTLFYTNNEQGEDSYKIPAPLIVARTVDALRRADETKTETSKSDSKEAASSPNK
jgi:peroxiredoxin